MYIGVFSVVPFSSFTITLCTHDIPLHTQTRFLPLSRFLPFTSFPVLHLAFSLTASIPCVSASLNPQFIHGKTKKVVNLLCILLYYSSCAQFYWVFVSYKRELLDAGMILGTWEGWQMAVQDYGQGLPVVATK